MITRHLNNNLFLVKWADGSASLIAADDKVDLFSRLDMESDPSGCTIFEVSNYDNSNFHFKFNIVHQGKETFIDTRIEDDYPECMKLKKTNLPKDVFQKFLARITGRSEKDIKSNVDAATMKKNMGIG